MPDTSLPFPTVCIITRTRPSVSRMKLISTSFQFMVSDGILCRLLMVMSSPRPHQTKQEKHPDEHGPALTSDRGIERLPISSYTSYLLLCYCATACCCVLLCATYTTTVFFLPFYVNPLTHYPLPTTHYPLPITHYPLPTSLLLLSGPIRVHRAELKVIPRDFVSTPTAQPSCIGLSIPLS